MLDKIADKLLKELSYRTGNYLRPPEFLSLLITMRCNFRCPSCAIWQKTDHRELDQEAWAEIIKKLAGTLKPGAFVEINGGEPLIKKDLTLFIIKELKKYFQKVALNSNGLLIDEPTLKELKQAGLDMIKISFYSLDRQIHNELRGGQPRAYEQAKQAIKFISKNGLELEIGLLLTGKNIDSAPELISCLKDLPKTKIIIQPLDQRVESPEAKDLNNNNLIKELWPDKRQTEAFFGWLADNRLNIKNQAANLAAIRQYYLQPANILKYRCFAGQRNLVVYPDGQAALCFKGGLVGDLNKQALPDILKQAGRERKKIKHCGKYCRIVGCNFSRGFKEFILDKIYKI